MKDIQDKSDELKKSGGEVLRLRKDIKFLKLENHNLKRRLSAEEEIQNREMLTEDIRMMHY